MDEITSNVVAFADLSVGLEIPGIAATAAML